LVGGINISDRYNDIPGQSAWLDWAIYIEGESAYELYKICDRFYTKNSEEKITLVKEPIMKAINLKKNTPVRIRRNDWVMNKNEISASYMNMFKQAEQTIIIMSSYFIPGAFFKRNIIKALGRGINIKLILAGISDVGIAKYAEKYLYRWAIRHGIEIYEYKRNILHGKIAVSDNKFVTVGSYNINDISALASIELNLDIENKEFASAVSQTLTDIINNDCERVSPLKEIKSFSVLEQLTHWISYELFRMIFTLFTFYFRKNRRASQLY
jgi:cardiolipin synthase